MPNNARNGAQTWRAKRLFYCGATAALWLVMFAGFARTFFLSSHFGTSGALAPLLVVHGCAMTAWLTLLVVQSTLIAADRVAWHRALGVVGSLLAALVTVLMVMVTFRFGQRAMVAGLPSSRFLFAVSLASPISFGALMLAALLLRGRGEYHKRLVILAGAELVSAALSRVPALAALGPVGFFGASDLFVAALAIHDWVTLRRVHPVTLWGGGGLLLSQPLRIFIAAQPAVLALTRHLIH